MTDVRLLIDGQWAEGGSTFAVTDKFSGATIATVAAASGDQVAQAVSAARRAFEQRRLSPYERYELLHRAARLVDERRSSLTSTMP